MTATTATRRWRSDLPDVEVGGTTLPAGPGTRRRPRRQAGPGRRHQRPHAQLPPARRGRAGRGRPGRARLHPRRRARPLQPQPARVRPGGIRAMAVGGAVTGANPLLTTEELAGQLADAEARLLVTVPPFLDRALAAADKAGVEVLVFGRRRARPRSGSCSPTSAPRRRSRSTRTATLPPSPTQRHTGLAKGVELTHTQLVTNLRQAQAVLGFREDDVVLAVAPFFHAMGFNILLACSLAAGTTTVTCASAWRASSRQSRHRATFTIVVPPSSSAWPTTRLSTPTTCRRCGCSASARRPSAPSQAALCRTARLHDHPGLRHDRDNRPRRHRPAPRATARLSRPAGTQHRGADRRPRQRRRPRPRPHRGAGCAAPRSCAATATAPEATAQTVDGDGWLHTGDLCYLDEDGYLFVVDRLKELIKYKGYQVAPAELEHLLLTPAVADAAVVPAPTRRPARSRSAHRPPRAGDRRGAADLCGRAGRPLQSSGPFGSPTRSPPRPASCCAASWWRPSAPGHASSAATSHHHQQVQEPQS